MDTTETDDTFEEVEIPMHPMHMREKDISLGNEKKAALMRLVDRMRSTGREEMLLGLFDTVREGGIRRAWKIRARKLDHGEAPSKWVDLVVQLLQKRIPKMTNAELLEIIQRRGVPDEKSVDQNGLLFAPARDEGNARMVEKFLAG